MKLFRIWLFGVPLAVASLLALGAISHRVAAYTQDTQSECLLDRQVDGVPSAIAKQRNGIPCRSDAVQ